jgi:hypothetical protein
VLARKIWQYDRETGCPNARFNAIRGIGLVDL